MGKVKEKKRTRKSRKAKVRSAPAPLVQGAADSVKMRVLTDLRDSGEGERRSDYGGDQIEDAALYAGQTAARGAEAFVRRRIAGLALKRPEAEEAPLYDLPFDLRVSSEPPVPAELPSSDVQPLAELPPAAPEAAILPKDNPLLPAEDPVMSAEDPVMASPSTSVELPAAEKAEPVREGPVQETSTPETPAEPAGRWRKHTETEALPVETKEESWTPAYRDTPEGQPRHSLSVKSAEKTPDTPVRGSGEQPKVRSRDVFPVRKPDSKVKELVGREAASGEIISTGERQAVKEKSGFPEGRQSPGMEAGRQKFIREQGRGAAAREPVAKQAVSVPERQSTRTPTDPLHSGGMEQHTPHIEANIDVMERVKREFVRERSQQAAVQRTDSGSATHYSHYSAHDFPTMPVETRGAAPVPVPAQKGNVPVQTVEASGYHSTASGAETPPRTALQSEQRTVRERVDRIAERPVCAGEESVPQIKSPPPRTDSGKSLESVSGKSPEFVLRERMPVKTREPYVHRETPPKTGEASPPAAQGRRKIIRERGGEAAEEIAAKRTKSNATASMNNSAKAASPITGESAPVSSTQTASPTQNRIPVKTRAVYSQQNVPSGMEAVPRSMEPGRQTAVRERGEEIAANRAEIRTAGEGGETLWQGRTAAYKSETPPAGSSGSEYPDIKTKRTRFPQEQPAVADTAPQSLDRGREGVAQVPKQQPLPVKTRKAYVSQQTPSDSMSSRASSLVRARDAVREQAVDAAVKRPDAGMDTQTDLPRMDTRMNGAARTENMTAPNRTQPNTPDREWLPVKTKEAHVRGRISSDTETLPRTVEQDRVQTVRERVESKRVESGQVSIKTREAYLQNQTPVTETTVSRMNKTVPREAPKELQKTVRTREGLTQSLKSSVASADLPESLSDKGSAVRGRGSHVAEVSAPQTEAVFPPQDTVIPSQAAALPSETNRRVSNVKTRKAYVKRGDTLESEQSERMVAQGRQRFVQAQKRKAEQKRTAERYLKITKARISGEDVEEAAEEAKDLAVDRTQQTWNIRTKEAWLREQDLDHPKERPGMNVHSHGKAPVRQAVGNTPSKLADGLPATDTLPGGRGTGGKETLSSIPGGESPRVKIKTRTPSARFIREKGGAAGETAGRVVRGAASGGSKGIKAVRPVIVKEAGKTTGKAVKTTARTSQKAVEAAESASAQAVWNAKQAAQAAARAKAVREASTHAVKRGARTVQEAAQAVASAAKAAAVSLRSLLVGLSVCGGVVLVVLLVICLIGLLVATPFGLFLSGRVGIGDNLQTAMSRLAGEYNVRVREIQEETSYDQLDIAEDIPTAMMDNWRNVLAVYAVRVTTDEFSATEVVTLTDEKLEVLRETFRDMNQISSHTSTHSHRNSEGERITTVTLHISAVTKSAEETAEEYGFTDRQKRMLEELLSPDYDELFDTLLGGSPVLVPGDLDGVLIPGDINEVRRQVIATGSQLLGRVHYFWGGKSLVLGWDSRWGTPKRVWAAGSPSTGTVRPFGLDCSGFVDWVFYNVSGGTYVIGHGGGASAQHSYCTTIPWSEAQPGDLAFYPGDSHVGIIVGYDDAGNVRIIHCASGSNNVVITGKIGFVTCGRPRYYEATIDR